MKNASGQHNHHPSSTTEAKPALVSTLTGPVGRKPNHTAKTTALPALGPQHIPPPHKFSNNDFCQIIWRSMLNSGVSLQAATFFLEKLAFTTLQGYNSAVKSWQTFCASQQKDILQPNLITLTNFSHH